MAKKRDKKAEAHDAMLAVMASSLRTMSDAEFLGFMASQMEGDDPLSSYVAQRLAMLAIQHEASEVGANKREQDEAREQG